jgi:hypothetical protein
MLLHHLFISSYPSAVFTAAGCGVWSAAQHCPLRRDPQAQPQGSQAQQHPIQADEAFSLSGVLSGLEHTSDPHKDHIEDFSTRYLQPRKATWRVLRRVASRRAARFGTSLMSRTAVWGHSPNQHTTQWRDRIGSETRSAFLTLDARLHQAYSGGTLSRSSSSLSSFSSEGDLGKSRPITASSAIAFSSYGRLQDPIQPRPPLAFGTLSRRTLPHIRLDAPFGDTPPEDQIEARWPGQRWGLGMPLRPSLRTASAAQDEEGIRFFNGVWRPRPATSPRATPV